MKKNLVPPACCNKKIILFLFVALTLLLSQVTTAQVVILQQGFDSTSGSHSNGTWTNVSQIQNGGNAWSNQGTGNDVIEGNKSCSGWSTCYDKTGNAYGITGGAPNFKGTGTNIGYTSTNSTYFGIFDDYDASYGSYGGIYTPTFSLSNYNSANLTFYWNNANTDDSYIQVQYWNGSSWTGVTNFGFGTGSLGWHQATMTLPSTATELVFFIVSDYEYYAIGIDQIEIYATPNCTLSASIGSSTNVSPCSTSTNGAASVTTTGGTTPFTYSWTPSSGLTGATTYSAGGMSKGVTYTCTVTDHNGCVATTTVTIGGPTAVSGTISSQTNVSCNGGNNGAVTIAGTGGTSPYTYSWSSGKGTNAAISSLSAGTYTCTVSDTHSCTGTVVVTITQPGLLRDSISSSSNALCNGGATGNATVGVKGGTSPYIYSWSPSGGIHATASNLAAGTYTCTVTDHNGCTNTATITITQPSAVTPTITSHNALCNGYTGSASVTTTGGTSPYTYSWSSGSTSSSINVYAGNYTVTATDHNGCTGIAAVTITQPADFVGTTETYNICGSSLGNVGAISVQLSGGTPPYTYSWNPNVSTTDSAYGLAPGTYTVEVNDANNCGPLVGTPTVYVITAETVSITSSYSVTCYGGNNGSATALGSPTHAYVWAPGGSTNALISSLYAGTYTVTATETDGCTATATVNISQPSAISPTITYTNTCSGSTSGIATVNVSGGTAPYTYSWNTSPVKTTATVTNLAAGNYTVTVTDHNSCVATATVTIATNPLPTLTVTPTSAAFCVGSSTSLTASGASTYTWSPSTGLSATTGATVTVNPTSTGTYTVTGTNSNACVNTQTVVITVNPLPTISISSPNSTTFCISGSASLNAAGASTYTWSPSSGLNATTGATVTASPTSTTTYTVTGTNSNGCVNTQTILITVNSLPTLTVTPSSATFCIGDSTSLTASGASTYTWSPSTGLSATTGATVTANPSSTKTYTVTGTNLNGCVNTQTVVITVNPLPSISVSPSAPSICIGGSTSLTSSGASTYTWSPSTGLNATTGATVTANPSSTKTYTVTGTNSNGCVNTQIVVVTVNSLPTVSVTALHDTICAGTLDSLKASGASTYTWSPSTDLSTTTGATVAAINMDTTITYTVTGTNASGCISSASQTILVHSLPIVNADTDLAHYITGGSFSAIGGAPPYTYNWSPIPANPLLLPDTLTTYTLTVTDANGCTTSDITSFYPTPNAAGPCGSLFISDYVQDTVNNDDAIELYNPTASAINLNGYYLITDSLYAAPSLIQLGGTIAAYGTYVIANSHADTALTHKANMLTDTLSLNGSDVVALAHIVPLGSYVHFTLLDKIGDLINMPTDSGWAASTGSTKNHTLVRKISIVMGNTNWSTCQNEWNVYPQGTFSYLKHFRNVCTPGDPHLIITMGTLATNCGGAPSTVDIPIYVQSDSDKIFNNCVMDIYYPTSEFYPDKVSNGGVTVTRGTDFTYSAGDNDYNILNVTNLSDSVIEIKFGDSALQSPYGTVVGSSQLLLLTVTLQIQNCNINPIDFTNTASTFLSSYYATYDSTATSIKRIDSTVTGFTTCCPHDCDPYLCNPHDCDPYCCEYDTSGNCILTCYNTCYDTCYNTCYDTTYQYHRDTIFNYTYTYNNIQYASTTYTGGGASSSVCLPIMSDYTNPIMAGTNQLSVPANSSLMTINGTDFGSTKGNIQVQNADAIGLITLDSTDILRWGNNQILVKMPSDLLVAKGKPGSGDFYVSNICGETIFDNLQINYNILSDDTGSEKLRPNVVMLNDTTSYIFRCDTSVSHNPKAYACVKKAIREWNCYTGIHWRVEADSTLAASKRDGISCIYFADPSIYSDSTTVMETTSQYFTTSCFDGTDSITFISEADISLNNSIAWCYDTTGTVTSADSNYFYDDILHELGHGHQLGHINDTASLMYWNTVPGLRVGITSGLTYPGPASLTGGFDVVNTSAARSPSSLGCGSYSILVPDTKICIDPTVGVPTITANPYNLTIFPNPINNGTLNVAYRLTQDADVQLRIVDCIGREIFQIANTRQNVGTYGRQINIDALAEGMYFFVATINGKDQVIKFVKL